MIQSLDSLVADIEGEYVQYFDSLIVDIEGGYGMVSRFPFIFGKIYFSYGREEKELGAFWVWKLKQCVYVIEQKRIDWVLLSLEIDIMCMERENAMICLLVGKLIEANKN